MDSKTERVLDLYTRLMKGEVLNKSKEADRFGVNIRSVQRDLDDIRAYFAESDPSGEKEVVYDRSVNGYRLQTQNTDNFTNSELLAICKILLESRSLIKDEMYPIIDKILNFGTKDKNQKVRALISNEKFHYLEPHHGKKLTTLLESVSNAVYEQKLLSVTYRKLKDNSSVTRIIQPVGIMFSEFYFYLCAYIVPDENEPDLVKHQFPTIYRLDRFCDIEILNKTFSIPYTSRFEEGEFRKRIQFMFGGELRTIHFLYKGLSVEAVLDRLPTAKIEKRDKDGWMISAEVYGDGVDMWLRSQGQTVELL